MIPLSTSAATSRLKERKTMTTPETNAAVQEVETVETQDAPAKKAAKKPAAKKAAAKKDSAPREARGHVYELTKAGEKLDPKEVSAQQAFIHKFFRTHGGKATVAQVAAAAEKDEKNFPCRQPRKRAVAYYFTDWKNKGLLKFIA